jgi:hypothetical protein
MLTPCEGSGLGPIAVADILADLAPVPYWSTSSKTVKGEKYGYKTLIQYLSPADYLSQYLGFIFPNMCAYASEACRDVCLGEHAGRMVFDGPKGARIRRTLFYHLAFESYLIEMMRQAEKHIAKARSEGLIPVGRLNGASDTLWERKAPGLFERFSDIEWYDYTKVPIRYRRNLPSNYHLTFSRSETNEKDCVEALSFGVNVAVVFRKTLPETYVIGGREYPVIDGDTHDIRLPHIDGSGVVVGLKAKGKGKQDKSGFVVG